MDQLSKFIVDNEQEIVDRLIQYAKDRDYYRYAAQDRRAWELAIRGLSNSLIDQCTLGPGIPELSPEEDYRSGPAGDFAIMEARMHRDRGITLPMFLGLMKYTRLAFQDTITDSDFSKSKRVFYHRFLDRFFDRVELGFTSAWVTSEDFSRES